MPHNFRKSQCLLLAACLAAGMAGGAQAGSVQFSTYYPAPFGMYDRLRLVPRAALGEPCDAGAFYYETGVGLQFCDEATQLWGSIGGVWTQSGDNIYPSDTATNPGLRVGIGTTMPGLKLDIDGAGSGLDDLVRIKNGGFSDINFRATGTVSGTWMSIREQYPSGLGIGPMLKLEASTNTWQIYAANASAAIGPGKLSFNNLMVIDPLGNVGIGTTAPEAKLDIRAPLTGQWQAGSIFLGNTENNTKWLIAQRGTLAPSEFQNLSFWGWDGVGWKMPLTMQLSTGSVGIGTTTPLRPLHVAGNVLIQQELAMAFGPPATQPTWHIDRFEGGDRFRIFRQPNLFAIGTEALTIVPVGPFAGGNPSGGYNVGIGTPAPEEKLHIQQGNILLKSIGPDPGDIIFRTSLGIQKGRIWANPSLGVNQLLLSSQDNTPDLTIDANGDIIVAGNINGFKPSALYMPTVNDLNNAGGSPCEACDGFHWHTTCATRYCQALGHAGGVASDHNDCNLATAVEVSCF